MFESAFALDTPGRRSPLLISFALQMAVVATLVILPLYFIEQLSVLPSMPVPVYTPKLPHMKILSVVRETASAMTPLLSAPRIFRAPTRIAPLGAAAPALSEVGMPEMGATPGGIPVDGLVFGEPKILPKPVPPPVAEKPAEKPVAKAAPVRIGGDVQAAKLIHQAKPMYPPLAKQTRTQGTVRLQAVIGRDGSIQNLVLASGHPLLVPAAMEAVRQWRYRPTTLNGETVEVLTQIDVNFTLSQ